MANLAIALLAGKIFTRRWGLISLSDQPIGFGFNVLTDLLGLISCIIVIVYGWRDRPWTRRKAAPKFDHG